ANRAKKHKISTRFGSKTLERFRYHAKLLLSGSRDLQSAADGIRGTADQEPFLLWCFSITPPCRWRPKSYTTAPACAGKPPICSTSTRRLPRNLEGKWSASRQKPIELFSLIFCRSTLEISPDLKRGFSCTPFRDRSSTTARGNLYCAESMG